ncbi:MAG: phosphotransferase, partial [Deltaproteobacteria bacterium]|nr:phosphotransferase [Deltaproteobacteria bacterium]
MTLKRTIDAYRFGSSLELNDNQLRTFIEIFNQPRTGNASVLGGRNALIFTEIDGIGLVAIKSYTRGGWIRYLIKRRYLKRGKTRAQIEFELLQVVRNLGINAPEPVAYAHSGHMFYQAWLVSRAIKHPQSLALLSLKDERITRQVMDALVGQISLLIQNGILHVDLHPGNIVVDSTNQIFLVDFDKGKIHYGSREKLRDRYLSRWQRAVVKHRLPVVLN